MGRYASWSVVALLGALTSIGSSLDSKVSGQAPNTQGLLGPGLYVFQTRTRGSTCNDSEKDGYVTTFLAAIDGVPGSTRMTMQLINNPHFVKWALTVEDGGKLEGSSKMGGSPTAPETHFEATLDGERWKGAGARTYNGTLEGKPTRCRVDYDALLRRIDTTVMR